LQYLHGCLGQFTELAAQLISRSPLQPRVVVFTKEDIIGDIKVTRC
jgi:hypothetical protein